MHSSSAGFKSWLESESVRAETTHLASLIQQSKDCRSECEKVTNDVEDEADEALLSDVMTLGEAVTEASELFQTEVHEVMAVQTRADLSKSVETLTELVGKHKTGQWQHPGPGKPALNSMQSVEALRSPC